MYEIRNQFCFYYIIIQLLSSDRNISLFCNQQSYLLNFFPSAENRRHRRCPSALPTM